MANATSLTITYKPGGPQPGTGRVAEVAPGEGGRETPRGELGGETPQPQDPILKILTELVKPAMRGLQAGHQQYAQATGQLNPLGRGTEDPIQAILRNLGGVMGLANVPGAAVSGAVASPVQDMPGGTYSPTVTVPGLGARQWPSAAETLGVAAGALTPGPKRPRGALTGLEQKLVLPVAEQRLAQGLQKAPDAEAGLVLPVAGATRPAPAAMPKEPTVGTLAKRNIAMPRVRPTMIADPGEAITAGQTQVQKILDNLWRPFEQAALYLDTPAERTLGSIANARVARNALSSNRLREVYLHGLFGEHWYEGAWPELQRGIQRLAEAANETTARTALDLQHDPLRLAKMVAATSPRTEPGLNLDNAIRALLVWTAHGRPAEGFSFTTAKASKGRPARTSTSPHASFMPGHGENLGRAARGNEPLSGLKVSNFVLDILGSQTAPTIDTWMVRMLLGEEFNNVPDWAYHVAGDRLTTLAQAWGTTPVRAQAALWTGYKLLHDDNMIALAKRGLTPEQQVPNLASQIRGGIDRAIQSGGPQTNWLNTSRLAALPVIGLAKLLIENDNELQQQPGAERPPS